LGSFLYSIDTALFRWINQGWSCRPLDDFFTFITDFHHFYFLVILWALYLLIWGKAKGRWLVLGLLMAVLLSDQTASHFIKGLIHRIRPCNALDGVLAPDGKSEAYSFPSSHAANMGASMFLLAMAYRRWTGLFILIALLVGLSRIYLGLHYPSDVLGGYVLGLVIGWGVWLGMEKMRLSLQNKPVKAPPLKGRKQRARKKR
jgi:undecaprenyl-diphosphatase